MTHLCVTCGTQFPAADHPPQHCPICEDERQFIRNMLHQEGEGIWGIATVPAFGIGQRALLIGTKQGNILWDCVSLIDSDTVALIKALGGIYAIAISHPHYYTSMVEWSRTFDGVPIYLHEDDRGWVQRPDANMTFWQGDIRSLEHGLTLIRVGGHFPGFQVLHSAEAENGQGALFTGDQPQVCPDKRYVSFITAIRTSFLSRQPVCAGSFPRLSRFRLPNCTARGPISSCRGTQKRRFAVRPSVICEPSKTLHQCALAPSNPCADGRWYCLRFRSLNQLTG